MIDKAFAILLGALFLTGPLQGALVLHYTFENEAVGALSEGASIQNQGSARTSGRVTGLFSSLSSIEIRDSDSPAGGNHLRMSRVAGAEPRDPAVQIDLGISLTDLGLTAASGWTMMAWIRFSPASFDNRPFSMAGDEPWALSYGTEQSQEGPRFSSRHATDNLQSDAGLVDLNGWHHVTWTNGESGGRAIYLDGLMIDLIPISQGGLPLDFSRNLALGGTRGFTNFLGEIDEVRIYDELLDASVIADLARPIPEPSPSLLFLAFLGAGLVARRR